MCIYTMPVIFDIHQIMSLQLRDFITRFISTGNIITDMILGIVVFRIALSITELGQSQFWQPVVEMYTKVFGDLKRHHRGQVEYSWYINPGTDNSKTKLSSDVSQQYKAIMYRIGKIKDDRVKRLRECFLDFYDSNDEDGSHSYINKNEVFYECTQSEPLEIVDDVFVNFSEKEELHTRQGNQIRKFQRKLLLYSERYRPDELTLLVDQWSNEYETSKKKKIIDQQMIFQIRFDSRGKQHTFMSQFHSYRSFENLNFVHKDRVLKELEFFKMERSWYEDRGLQHTLGILCHGEPGCGKTSFIKALLQHTKRHAVVFSINAFTQLEDIEKLMRTDRIGDYPIPQENRLYVFEDVDAMGDLVKKRLINGKDQTKNKVNESTILNALFGKSKKRNAEDLGLLLNLLDGVMESPGRIIVMTTNFIHSLDPALIRPGRVDLMLEFGRCRPHDVIQILSQFYDVSPDIIKLPTDLGDHEITPARLVQICRGSKRSLKAALQSLEKLSLSEDSSYSPLEREELGPYHKECELYEPNSQCLDCQQRMNFQCEQYQQCGISTNKVMSCDIGSHVTLNIRRN